MKILFPKKSREIIFKKISEKGEPRDFFYGSLESENFDIENSIVDTRPSKKNFNISLHNKIFNRIFRCNFSKQKSKHLFESIPLNSRVICFTDWDSINIALHHSYRKDLKLICGFHGLINFFERTPENFFFNKKKLFCNALKKIHHIFFFGPEDRKESLSMFKIPENKTSLYRFGVDTEFWNKKFENEEIDVLSIGSDINRNYDIYSKMNINFNLTIITKLKTHRLDKKIKIFSGSKNEPNLSNLELKNYYNKAKIIAIPVKETLQPSGYSVTLQAMACGKPVIMTKIKGLWENKILKDMKNIIFVPPEDPKAMHQAIDLLLNNQKLREKIALDARKTAVNFFSLKRMNEDFKNLLNI